MITRRKFAGLLAAVPLFGKAVPVSVVTPDTAQTLSHNPQSTAEAWAQFAGELSRTLSDLNEDEFLIIETKKHGYYIQLAGQGGFGLRMESVSDAYLDDDRKLSEQGCAKLLELGWSAPTNTPDNLNPEGDGSPNYFLDIDAPVPYSSVASLAVNTLRGVFGATHPGKLRYRAFAKRGDDVRFPSLRIARER